MVNKGRRGTGGAPPFPKNTVYSGAGVLVPSTFVASTFVSPVEKFGALYTTYISGVDLPNNLIIIPGNNGRLARTQTVRFLATTGTLPAPLQLSVEYFVVYKDPIGYKFRVSLTEGGEPITITSAGSAGVGNNLELLKTDLGSTIPIARAMDSNIPTWNEVNTAFGVYDWTNFDRILDYQFKERGRRILLCLYNAPSWATGSVVLNNYGVPGGGQVPTDLTYAATYIAAMLNRYNAVSVYNPTGTKMIWAIEAWNEPSFAAPGTVNQNWCGTISQLATQQRHIFNAAKAIDPSILILGPGFTYGHAATAAGLSLPSLYNWYKASDGVGTPSDWCEGGCYHGYSIGDNIYDLATVAAKINQMKLSSTLGGGTADLYQTERGVEVGTHPLTHPRVMIVEAALGVKMSDLYSFDFWGATPRDFPETFAAMELLVSKLCGKTLTYCAINQDNSVTFTANGETFTV